MKNFLVLFLYLFTISCSTADNKLATTKKIDIKRFMGNWYVLAGRFTFLEVDVHNGLEIYTWNEEKNRIDVDFSFNKGALDGPKKSYPQKAWIFNKDTNAHWKVSPFWPLKFDYLILEIDENYSWTAIGVPDQKYLWIMARDWKNADKVMEDALFILKAKGYDINNLVTVPHQ